MSLSARRAWIEMLAPRLVDMSAASLSARRAWIEIRRALGFVDPDKSLSARRAWIEITYGTRTASRYISRSPQGERG